MFFARELRCIAHVSSVSPSSEQTEGLWRNQISLGIYIFIVTGFVPRL